MDYSIERTHKTFGLHILNKSAKGKSTRIEGYDAKLLFDSSHCIKGFLLEFEDEKQILNHIFELFTQEECLETTVDGCVRVLFEKNEECIIDSVEAVCYVDISEMEEVIELYLDWSGKCLCMPTEKQIMINPSEMKKTIELDSTLMDLIKNEDLHAETIAKQIGDSLNRFKEMSAFGILDTNLMYEDEKKTVTVKVQLEVDAIDFYSMIEENETININRLNVNVAFISAEEKTDSDDSLKEYRLYHEESLKLVRANQKLMSLNELSKLPRRELKLGSYLKLKEHGLIEENRFNF